MFKHISPSTSRRTTAPSPLIHPSLHPPLPPPLLHAGGGLRASAMAKIRVSYEYSEAEDKSIRLGLFLIACGILSLFILGFCWLSPTLQSLQSKPANCTVSPATSSELPPLSEPRSSVTVSERQTEINGSNSSSEGLLEE